MNVTIHKKLIVCFFRYVDENGCAKTVFHGNYTVAAGDAETTYNKPVEVCEKIGLDPRKIVGLGSDGASVMLGKKTGVGVRLKARSPHLTHVHCIAHRVNLAASGAAKLESVDRYRKYGQQFLSYLSIQRLDINDCASCTRQWSQMSFKV